MGDMIKKGNGSVSTIIQGMMSPTETVKQITNKVTVKTDEATHTVWQVGKPSGNTATFTQTKRNK